MNEIESDKFTSVLYMTFKKSVLSFRPLLLLSSGKELVKTVEQ